MRKSQFYAPFVGAVAVGSLIALFILTTAFAVNLIKIGQPIGGLAVASVFLGGLALIGMLLVAGRHFLHIKNGHGAKGSNWLRQKTLVAITIILPIIWSPITIATFTWMLCTSKSNLPPNTLGASTRDVVYAAIVLWAISTVSQTFYIKELIHVRREFLAAQPATTTDEERQTPLEISETSRQPSSPSQLYEKVHMDNGSRRSISSSHRRSGSDAMSSIRNSFTKAVKPITSKSRSHRAVSLDSGTGEREIVEDGFDSWDTSSAETTTWQTALGSSATIASSLNTAHTHPHVLETIPASPPASSRSPSPRSPLDPPPPNTYARYSRSQSSASFDSMKSKASSTAGSEYHIHPLFRSSSPTAPPSTTPTSVITAAPNAGQVLSDLAALRRKRSGSLPGRSQLIISTSFDSIFVETGRGKRPQTAESTASERESAAASDGERAVTPPIPDWVMGAGQRASLHGYVKRKSDSTRFIL